MDLSGFERVQSLTAVKFNAVKIIFRFDPILIFGLNYRFFFQPEQLEEIQEIIEMKVGHRKNIKRRGERFGHTSNSLIGLNMGAADVIAPEEGDEEDPYA